MDAFEILVIILSIALGIFLTLGIVLLILVIKITRHIKNIVEKAESVVDDVESVSQFFKKSAFPVAIGKLVGNIVETFSSKNDKK